MPKLTGETTRMLDRVARLRFEMQRFHTEEDAQDLVEYALVAVIIALAATAGMGSVAKEINDIFSKVAQKIAGYGI